MHWPALERDNNLTKIKETSAYVNIFFGEIGGICTRNYELQRFTEHAAL